MMITLENFLLDVAKYAIKGDFYDIEDQYHLDWFAIVEYVINKREELEEKKIMKQIIRNRRKSAYWEPIIRLDFSYEQSTFVGNNDECYHAGFALDNINNWYKLKLSKYKKKNNSYRIVDMFLLQLTSLVVCRGKHNDKANQFVELLMA